MVLVHCNKRVLCTRFKQLVKRNFSYNIPWWQFQIQHIFVVSTVFILSLMNATLMEFHHMSRLVTCSVNFCGCWLLHLLAIIKIVSSMKYIIQLHFVKEFSKLYFLKVKGRHERSPCSPCICVCSLLLNFEIVDQFSQNVWIYAIGGHRNFILSSVLQSEHQHGQTQTYRERMTSVLFNIGSCSDGW
jgi:hypothetical protein